MVTSLGIKSSECDGNDIKKIFKICSEAVNFVKKNNKPYFLIFNNYRWREHCGPNYDNHIGYRTSKEFLKWKKKDPLTFANNLIKKLRISNNQKNILQKNILKKINSAFNFAKKSKFPKKSEVMKDIYR